MTQEDKELLFKDLSARLPYGVICECSHSKTIKATAVDTEDLSVYYFDCDEWESIEHCKPYLRPMSSMTEEELNECMGLSRTIDIPHVRNWFKFAITNPAFTDWLNAHHFDHRGLIEKGLALEAPEGMYK